MSRQNKQARQKALKIQIRRLHAEGKKFPFTKKLTSIKKGKCKIIKISNRRIRVSISEKQQEEKMK